MLGEGLAGAAGEICGSGDMAALVDRERGAERGATPEAWALGWHRMWAVEWFMEQAIRWIDDPAKDPAYIPVVRRHLGDVVQLLEV